MRRAIQEMLDAEQPDVVLTETIDQFLIDLLRIETLKRGVPFVGLVGSFVNGYFRISSRGELVTVRQVSDDETAAVLNRLRRNDYLPQNLESIRRKIIRRYLYVWLANIIKPPYFRIKRLLSDTPYNYHYWSTEVVSRAVSRHWIPSLFTGDENWREKSRASGRRVVFVPLQHCNEATIDYWCSNIEVIDYQRVLLEVLRQLSLNFSVIVKEHPGVLGFRRPDVYREMRSIPNVVLVPTTCRAQECIEASEAVLVWTGSVGFEAALRGKPVLCLGKPYFASGPMFRDISSTLTDEDLAFVEEVQQQSLSDQQAMNMVRHVLGGMYAGRFQNDGTFNPQRQTDVADAIEVGMCVRSYINTHQAELS
jgi:hypothetical protein